MSSLFGKVQNQKNWSFFAVSIQYNKSAAKLLTTTQQNPLFKLLLLLDKLFDFQWTACFYVPFVNTTPKLCPLMEGHLRKQSYAWRYMPFPNIPTYYLVTEKPLKFKKSSEAVNKVMPRGFIQITTLFTTTKWILLQAILYEIPTFMINYGVILNIYLFEISVMRNLQICKALYESERVDHNTSKIRTDPLYSIYQ